MQQVPQHSSEHDKASRGSDNADQQDYHQITIEQPVHHDGSEALVKWALVERLIGLALGAHEVNAGGQSLRAHCERGAGIVQLAAHLSHSAMMLSRVRSKLAHDGVRNEVLFAPAMGLKKEQGERGRRRADLARLSA